MDALPMIGKELGNYVVRSLLGEGGMGAVYVAEHRFLGTRAAIKVLHGSYANNPEVAQRFFQEAKSSLEIKHPGIIQILDFGQSSDGALYLVMELLEGASLAQAIAGGALGEGAAARIGAALADALAAAHGKGIVHRDLKPDNIFLAGEQVKILDFGIAKVLSGSAGTKTGSLMGTPQYMAPEQAKGSKGIGPCTDIYALGAILFEMVVGKPPFDGDVTALIGQHLFSPPPRPSTLVKISAEFEAIILECLEKEPTSRPVDMVAVQTRLLAINGSGSSVAMPIVSPRSGWQGASTISGAASEMATVVREAPARKARAKWIALAGVAVVAVVGAGIGFSSRRSTNPASTVVVPAVPAPALPTIAPSLPRGPDPAAAPVAAAIDQVVQLASSPAGAEVTDGPKLLGRTPLAIKLGEARKSIALRLARSGFDDLTYTLTPADAPSLSLKLVPSRHRGGESKPVAAPDRAGHGKPKKNLGPLEDDL